MKAKTHANISPKYPAMVIEYGKAGVIDAVLYVKIAARRRRAAA